MPRYCAVKVCRNRGGTASRQDKRISFYPFPLQDKSRLQKWVDNMKREKWTPSRHQYLCSEHFKEDCFDIRWGIRYLKNTAIPTLFPSIEDVCTGLVFLSQHPSVLTLKGLIAGHHKISYEPSFCSTNSLVCEHTEMIVDPPLASDTGVSRHSNLSSEIRTAACEIPGDSGMPTASCIALSPCSEPHSEEKADSIVTVLCCESVGPFSDGEENVDAFSYVPVELVMDEPTASFLEDRGPSEVEHIYVYEHSYCRPDTDKDQLWRRILSLHAKILGLDRREESTLAKIRALETEVALLKRDGAVFKEKQKVLEDYISSMLL
uniref:THAP domain-containing protein 5 n=1 Tax=Sander lucioperca TaxID=283035 RepID=A0A8C9ZZE8_SANLU